METIINLSIFIILIVLTGFFVATEFAIVKIRSSRIDQLVIEGKRNAKAAQHVVSHLDEYLSACQLGITVTALGIGMVGESAFEFILHPMFEFLGLPEQVIKILTIAVAFMLATFSHVVIGELAPKTIAIQKAEQVTLLFSKPIIVFYKMMFPLIWCLNISARLILKIFGLKAVNEYESTHTEEELLLLMQQSYESGEINQNELNYVNNAFDFDNRIAREVMVPRTEMVAIESSISIQDLWGFIEEEKYTRYPIYEGDRDNIIGFLNIKDFFTSNIRGLLIKENFDIKTLMNPLIRVIDTISIQELFQKMKKEQVHMAILMDEYGGTSGLVTIEDIIEVLVGDIRDEFDGDEIPNIEQVNDTTWKVVGTYLLEDLEKILEIEFDNNVLDTIGGWFLQHDGEIKKNSIEFKSYIFTILKKENNHIHLIEKKKIKIE